MLSFSRLFLVMNNVTENSTITSSFDWSVNLNEMRGLDNLLRCRICRSYFETCMTTCCSHNFCSRCVRDSMTVDAKCPLCFKVTAEPSLRKNILVDEIVKVFLQLRNKHLETLNKLFSSTESQVSSETAKEIKCEKQPCDTAAQLLKTEIIDITDENPDVKGCLSSPISCDSGTSNSSTNGTLRNKYLPKIVYDLMTTRQLQKKLKEHGLSTKGDKKILISRHRRFIALYNSNCDSDSAKSDSEILKILEQEEQVEKIKEKNELATLNRNTPSDIVDAKLSKYRKRHKPQFDELIRNVKRRTDK